MREWWKGIVNSWKGFTSAADPSISDLPSLLVRVISLSTGSGGFSLLPLLVLAVSALPFLLVLVNDRQIGYSLSLRIHPLPLTTGVEEVGVYLNRL